MSNKAKDELRQSLGFLKKEGYEEVDEREGIAYNISSETNATVFYKKGISSNIISIISFTATLADEDGYFIAHPSIELYMFYNELDSFFKKMGALSKSGYEGLPMMYTSPTKPEWKEFKLDTDLESWSDLMKEHLSLSIIPMIKHFSKMKNYYEYIEFSFRDEIYSTFFQYPAGGIDYLIRLFFRAYYRSKDFYEYSECLIQYREALSKEDDWVAEMILSKLVLVEDFMSDLIPLFEDQRSIDNPPREIHAPALWREDEERLKIYMSNTAPKDELQGAHIIKWYKEFWDNGAPEFPKLK